MKTPEIEKKFAEMNNDEERNVADLLLELGLTFVDANVRRGESPQEYLGEIDSLFTWNEYLFLIEVSKERNSNEKKFTFFTKWADNEILELITKPRMLQSKKIIRVYFDLSTKTPENKSPYLQILTRPHRMNKVVYLDDYENFLNFAKSGTSNLFLDWILK